MFKHVPNLLSAFRIALVPLFALVFFSSMEGAWMWALGIYVLAGLTDILDGYLARKYHLITKVGTVLDPLADKLMQLTALVCLSLAQVLPYWLMTLFLLKETAMIVTATYMYFRKASTVMPANYFGKSATVLFSLAIFITLLWPESLMSFLLVIGALGLKLIALASYIYHYFNHVKPHLKDGE